MKSGRFKAVFLDRDDTLMPDPGYCSDPALVRLFPGVPESLARLRAAGFKLVIVTNQSGIGRGLFGESEFWAVQTRLETLLGSDQIAATYFCPDHPDSATDRRKPAPGMLFEAARDLDLDLSASFLIGDKESDIEAGLNAGVRGAVWVNQGVSARFADRTDVWLAPDMVEAARIILRFHDERP